MPTTLRWVLWTPEGLFDHAPTAGRNWSACTSTAAAQPDAGMGDPSSQAYRALYAPRAVRARHRRRLRARRRNALAQLGEVRERDRTAADPGTARSALRRASGAGCRDARSPGMRAPAGRATALRMGFTTRTAASASGPLDVLVNDRIAARGAAPRPSARGA